MWHKYDRYRVDSPPPSRSSPRKIGSRVEFPPLGGNPALEPAFPLQVFGVEFPPKGGKSTLE